MTNMVKDGLWLLTIRKGQAFVPTMARTQAGFYMGIEPIAVVNTADREGIEQAMIGVVSQGNPIISTPTRDNFPQDPLLKHAKVGSLSSFEKLAQTWKLSKNKGVYWICPYRPGRHGRSEEDKARAEAIPEEEPLESVVRRLVALATENVHG